MKGIAIVGPGDAADVTGHPVAGHSAGDARARMLGPAGFSLWMVALDLPAGQPVDLPEQHGDEVLYVRAGEVVVDGVVCPEGGAVVIESGAHPSVAAVNRATVLHMGPRDPVVPVDGPNGPITRTPDSVHVVGPGGRFALSGPGRAAKYFVDSTCDGCRATLLHNSREGAHVAEPHSHSQDELMYVLSGEIRFGAHRVGAGGTVAIAAHQRYSFRSQHGFTFLNFRRDASRHISADGDSRMEGALVNGMLPVIEAI
ncbi:MAG TPA: hypothetical protein VNQ73_07095 [Ilumatobacter sp.]|nr:hypothetical protein [Ilumatobacter sp.]